MFVHKLDQKLIQGDIYKNINHSSNQQKISKNMHYKIKNY